MNSIVLDHRKVLSMLPERPSEGHKGCFGKLLLVCGSLGYTGAPALAAMGALRCGAGLVYLAVPACIYQIEAAKLTEPIVFPLRDDGRGFSADAAAELYEHLDKADAVLIGPGLGTADGALHMVSEILGRFPGPVIVDADGINVLAAHKDRICGRTGVTILTPHEGEFSRMGGDLSLGRKRAAVAMAEALGAIIVLKGHRTVVTDGVQCYENHTGNPGMAVGGSGDVLAGMIAGLLGQGISPLEAAACAVYLHGAAGDACAAELGQYALLPSDMLRALPRFLK